MPLHTQRLKQKFLMNAILKIWGRKWQPIPVFLPGESQGWSVVGCRLWGCTESDTTEAT